jgi:hypothetical protein
MFEKLQTNENKNKKDNFIFEQFIFNKDNRKNISTFWRSVDRKFQAIGKYNENVEFIVENSYSHLNMAVKIKNLMILK